RAGLAVADTFRALRAPLDGARKWSGMPKWSETLPRPARWTRERAADAAEHVVYFPSCASRSMGAQRGDDAQALPDVAQRVLAKAGFGVLMPARLSDLCCGQPFESKGFAVAADRKSAELEAALHEASAGGRRPIVFDTSPCAYRMKRFVGGRL